MKGRSLVVEVGHGHQGGHALGSQGSRFPGIAQLGCGMDGQVPAVEDRAGERHDQRQQAGAGDQFVRAHLVVSSLGDEFRCVAGPPYSDGIEHPPQCRVHPY